MNAKKRASKLFETSGLELEYMVVDRDTLEVRPIVDKILLDGEGSPVDSIDRGDLAWHNELARHILELRPSKPAKNIGRLRKKINSEVKSINNALARHNAMLLPTGAHPFMDPTKETVLWDHGKNSAVYTLCDKLFGCHAHGWSNVLSAHLEFSFADDEEFGKLHAAARLLLPIIPALSASSPLLDGRYTGFLDSRMEAYLHAQERFPVIMGSMVPEAIFDQEEYYREIYGPIVQLLSEHDPQGSLDHQLVNTRGTVPYFERSTMQIRVIDMQECISGDLAIAEFVTVVLKALTNGRWVSSYVQRAWPETDLLGIFLQVIKDAGNTMIANRDYLLMFGLLKQDQLQCIKLWQHLFVDLYGDLSEECRQHIGHILEHGCLAQRILKHTGREPSREKLTEVYGELAVCLREDRPFL